MTPLFYLDNDMKGEMICEYVNMSFVLLETDTSHHLYFFQRITIIRVCFKGSICKCRGDVMSYSGTLLNETLNVSYEWQATIERILMVPISQLKLRCCGNKLPE